MKVNEYEMMLNMVSDGLCLVSADGIIKFFNAAAEKMTGRRAKDIVGKRIENIFDPRACPCAGWKDAIHNSKPTVNRRSCILGSMSRQIPITVNITPVIDNGSPCSALVVFHDDTEFDELRKQITLPSSGNTILTQNSNMKNIMSTISSIAATRMPALILGESGTGKELFARAIHDNSENSSEPFMAVNCGAIPDNLLESELFGHVKGAYTGAIKNRQGRFKEAKKGTLFLDEIGDVSPAMQVKLLRVLQEKEFTPLGSDQKLQSECRIVAATNKNIKSLISQGKFREDLYYRLGVVEITIPSLRERMDDLVLLKRHFMDMVNAQYGHRLDEFDVEARKMLMRYNYPGNVRQLENIVQRAYVMCVNGIAGVECLPRELITNTFDDTMTSASNISNSTKTFRQLKTSGMDELEILTTALERNNYHRLKTAQELDINPSTLWRKMKKYAIEG